MLETGNNPLTDKRLSIRVHAGGFSFFSAAATNHFACSAEQLAERLRAELERFALLNNDFESVVLLVDSPSTRVPLNEFRSEEALSLYRLTFGNDAAQGQTVRYDVLPLLELVELYTLDPDIEETVHHFYPEAQTLGLYGQVLAGGLEVDKHMPLGKRRMHASVWGSQLMLFTFVDNRLSYCNTFETDGLQTSIYYIMYVWTHMELAQERDILVMHGKNEELLTQLKRFIRDIECV